MTAPQKTTFRPGTVVKYLPSDENRANRMWCREGLAIANERGVLVDTYWEGGSEAHVLRRDDELATVEVLFHLGDYRELPRGERHTWEDYHPDDRRRVTSQHGLSERRFVAVGAKPDLETKIDNAREALREAEERVVTSRRQVEWRRELLAELEAQR